LSIAGDTNSAGTAATNSEPFRIEDYRLTAAQLQATARQLTEMLVTFDQTLGSTNLTRLSTQVGPAVQRVETSGRQIVDYAFRKGLLLVSLVLAAIALYRFFGSRGSRLQDTASQVRPSVRGVA
jgi:hypothetical protein